MSSSSLRFYAWPDIDVGVLLAEEGTSQVEEPLDALWSADLWLCLLLVLYLL